MGTLRSVLVVLLAGLGAAGCRPSESQGSPQAGQPAAQRAWPVRWAKARALAGGEDYVDLEALLNSPSRVPLGFKVAGRLVELHCEEGSFVPADPAQPIGKLETIDYEIARQAADATLKRAQAAYGRAHGVGVSYAERELERGREVAAAGVIPERDLQGLETQLDDMEAQAGEAAAAILQARALLAQAEQALADTVLVAPFAGLVVKRMAEPGQLLGQGMPACVIERTDALDAVASLPGNLLASLVRERAPRVTVHDAGGVTLDGSIEAAAWAGDVETGTFPVKVRVPNPDGTFRSGMRVTVRLWLRRGGAVPGETIWEIPLEAVVSLAGKTWVFAAAADDRAAVRRIEVDVRELGRDGLARVAAAFPGPALVVAEGQYGLLDVDAVELPVREVAPP
ncbi:MAG: efflux RND transporter periplasmic adaptor subunit [Deltaproteobacteria bacterium]|nr:efflux RND transporter periplasmic adaptor subunit [Deltaproteobacteria bacterium]